MHHFELWELLFYIYNIYLTIIRATCFCITKTSCSYNQLQTDLIIIEFNCN